MSTERTGDERAEILIVGGGVAGLATAYFLAREGVEGVVLLERESQLASHSSGLNAAILRTLTSDPYLTELAQRSARFLLDPPEGFAAHPLIDPVGLWLTADEARAEALLGWWRGDESLSPCRERSRSELRRAAPYFAGSAAACLQLPAEGRIDIAALLEGFARGARAGGVELRTGEGVSELLTSGGRIEGVRTRSGRELRARWTCLAAGGWAGRLGASAGSRVSLRPTRRHLLVTGPDDSIDPAGPVLWSSGDDFYCRPESGGWLLCGCDQTDVDPDDCRIDPGVRELVADKTARHLPDYADAEAAHFWCGMRTMAADGRFAVGPDPDLAGLFWIAGLGGHGMVASAEVGRLAARRLAGRADAETPELDPARMIPQETGRSSGD